MAEKFSQLPNELIEDTRISAKAFRVAAYLFSRPSGWEVKNADIMKKLSISDEGSLAKYWKELMVAGWVSRQKQAKGEDGKFSGAFDYTLNIAPVLSVCGEKPDTEKIRTPKKPVHGKNPDLNNTDSLSNTDSLNNTDLAEKSAANESPKTSFDERAEKLRNKIRENKGEYTNAMLYEFFNYWTEKNENGKKMRFEMQKVFDVKKRLATWHKRATERTFKPKEQQLDKPQVYVAPKNEHFAKHFSKIESLAANAAQKMRM